jgi:hypothetical protein
MHYALIFQIQIRLAVRQNNRIVNRTCKYGGLSQLVIQNDTKLKQRQPIPSLRSNVAASKSASSHPPRRCVDYIEAVQLRFVVL